MTLRAPLNPMAPMDPMDFSTLSEQERADLLAYHLDIIKRLRASMLRSDWHKALEAIMRMDFNQFKGIVDILVEEELGIDPPRADFIVLKLEQNVDLGKSIYAHFRSVNVIEYKNPHDSLNDGVLRKAVGYANMYIAEKGVDAGQVTLSVIRHVPNPELFDKLHSSGRLKETETPGVYILEGYTDLPFRLIITRELKGDEYAAYRSLTDHADENDVRTVINDATEENRRYLRVLLNLVAEKNPGLIESIRGRDKGMYDAIMEIFKDEIAQRENEARMRTLADLVDDGTLSEEKAAEKMGMTVDEFNAAVDELKAPV